MMLPFGLDPVSFGAGFLTAVVIAFIVTMTGWLGRQMGAPMKPMTVVHFTNRTPWQVSMGCASATLLVVGVAALVAVFIVVRVWDADLAEIWWIVLAALAALLLGLVTRAMT